MPPQVVISDSSCLIDLRKTSLLDAFVRLPYVLTGDGPLRTFARRQKIEVHGVLWVIDELQAHAISTAGILLAALRVLASDPTVRLPRQELAAYLKRYGGG